MYTYEYIWIAFAKTYLIRLRDIYKCIDIWWVSLNKSVLDQPFYLQKPWLKVNDDYLYFDGTSELHANE